MLCSGCGAEMNAGDAFCRSCGSSAAAVGAMAPPPPPVRSPMMCARHHRLTSHPAATRHQPVAEHAARRVAPRARLQFAGRNLTLVLLVGGALLAIGALCCRGRPQVARSALPRRTARPSCSCADSSSSCYDPALHRQRQAQGSDGHAGTCGCRSVGHALNATNASDDVDAAKELGIDAALGAGIFIAIVGAVMAGIASFLLLRATRTGVQPQSSPT